MLKNTDIQEIYLPRIEQDWLKTQEQPPSFMEKVSASAEESAEKNIAKQLAEFETLAKSSEFNGKELENKLNQMLQQGSGSNFTASLDKETFDAAREELKAFLRKIREFAPDMGIEDIGKAARNYLVYAMFNILNDVPQKCTESIFGYSMLYPVTDNFLDETGISAREKKEYNEFIKDKLRGFNPVAKTEHQALTGKLLDMVERDYPRGQSTQEPEIYMVLLHMLTAQEESLLQQGNKTVSEDEIFKISAYKGGISVLADRCFVKKQVEPKEVCFYLALGLILQLGDDLQDIGEDIKSGSQTLFASAKS
ncbi:MAG: class 1 isoprenoid biosynthesis enzyme, partial [Oscillospiraceae bacterium]